MKQLILLLSLVICSFTLIAAPTPSIEKPVLSYLETTYGPAISVTEESGQTILDFCDYRILMQDHHIVGLYNFKKETWEDPAVERAKLESFLMHYSVINVLQDDAGTYLSITRYDGSFEYRFYFEEYYLSGNKLIYYNNTEQFVIEDNKAYYLDIAFNFLN